MSNFLMHPSKLRTKVLICGNSGSGKTTLLASLANAGYRVHVIDLDQGLDILSSYLTPEGAKNLFYVSMDKDDKTTVDRALALTHHWKTPEEDHGLVSKWGEKDVLVLDTLSFYANACLAIEKTENGELKDERQFFKKAGPKFDNMVTQIYSSRVPCNVVVNTHLRVQETETGAVVGMFPAALGKAYSRTIGQYFNNVWRLDVKHNGDRVLKTKSDNLMALKCSAPKLMKIEEEPDLAKMFEKVKQNAVALKELFEKSQTKNS